MDWTATCLAASGAVPAADCPLDRVNLLPLLIGQAGVFERAHFWRAKAGPFVSFLREKPLSCRRNYDERTAVASAAGRTLGAPSPRVRWYRATQDVWLSCLILERQYATEEVIADALGDLDSDPLTH